jgi:hypothetical protein
VLKKYCHLAIELDGENFKVLLLRCGNENAEGSHKKDEIVGPMLL